jgi:uncharacterized protein (DUF2235 family)
VARALVVCCDGTWDTPTESSGSTQTSTNVYKLWRGVADTTADGDPQLTFYHDGVGTGGPLDRVFGGAFGAGLAHNVIDCYRFLAQNFRPGDRLYLFGFSRGAYTARSVAGMVRNCGILTPENLGRMGEAFTLYRDRGPDTAPAAETAQKFRNKYAHETLLHFVGVWDTVGSLGVPVRIPFVHSWWRFHDAELSSTVSNAYHALAIDEERGPFKPTVWTRKSEPENQTLGQVWFAGVHRDVGGGYPDPDLADITLRWMVLRAQECGLAFRPDHFQSATAGDALQRCEGMIIEPNPLGPLHTSDKGFWGLGWRHRRTIPEGAEGGYALARQTASSTAIQRADEDTTYHPPQLVAYRDNPPVRITDVA